MNQSLANTTLTKSAFTIGLLATLLALPAFGASINKSVKIGAGEESGGATSVNGSISVGSNAVVSGGVKTVNGTIRIDEGASVETAKTVNGALRLADNVEADDLSTVNGSIQIGTDGNVDGHVEAVNGRITIEKGTRVARDVKNVNGEISLRGVTIGGDVGTVSGDVEVVDGTVIDGDLVIEKPRGWGNKKRRTPRVVIGPGSTVKGVIELEQKVDLYISDTASVGGVTGVMSLDDAKRFSGDKP